MRAQAVDAIWRAAGNPDTFARGIDPEHAPTIPGVSWVGFYSAPNTPWTLGGEPVTTGPNEMLLGDRMPKPACSPIGLHGVCGKSALSKQPIVVRDVRSLGDDYVACDPLDRAELVVPCLDEQGNCTCVLDLDSFMPGAFTNNDATALAQWLVEAGLSDPALLEAPVSLV